jgi:hypothetical protein
LSVLVPSVQDLSNLKQDVDDLAEIVNGSSATEVDTRYGGKKPSVSKAIADALLSENMTTVIDNGDGTVTINAANGSLTISVGGNSFSTLSDAVSNILNGGVQPGSTVKVEERFSGTGVGGNDYTLLDAGSAGARPAQDNGSVIHVGSDGLYLYSLFSAGYCFLEQFGANPSDITTHSAAFVAAAAHAKQHGIKIRLKKRTYYVDPDLIDLIGGDILTIEGEDKEHSKIESTGNGAVLIGMTTNAKLRLRDLTLSCGAYNCPIIYGVASNANFYLSVQAERVIFDVSGHNKCYNVFLQGFKDDTYFKNCRFIGSDNPTLVGAHYNVQRLLSIPDDGQPNGDRSAIVIDSCVFINGCHQFSTFGTSSPASPIHLINNRFYGAFCRAIHFYHGEDSFAKNNYVIGARGYKTTIEENNIGGAVWLDIYSAITPGTHNAAIYQDNVIRNCAGVGLFVEEMFGVLSGWAIFGTTVFPENYTFDNGEGFVTDGGIGMVITGGSRRLSVSGRFEDNEIGVIADSSLGVDPDVGLGIISFDNANIDQNKKQGIIARNKIEQLNVHKGTLVGNGTASANTYDAIFIDRDTSNTDKLQQLKLDGVVFDDKLTTVSHRHCVGKSYVGMYMDVEKCTLNSLSQWIESGGTVSGQIRWNICMDNRYWGLAGTDKWFYQNIGYPSEDQGVATITNGYGEINLTLATTPHRATVQVINATGFVHPNYEIDTVNRRLLVSLRDAAGNLVSGTHKVSYVAVIAKSSALIG